MSLSTGDQYPVHVGTWINWSRGRVLGSTLTLSRQHDADLLIAFTAFFIAFVATRTWRILCFILHRNYSTPEPQDAAYHQRQAILRNSTSPEDGLQLLGKLLWSNRRSAKRFRPLMAATIAVLCITGFTLAGGYSSQISTVIGDEVLLKDKHCGYILKPDITQTNQYAAFQSYYSERTDSAANYAQQCYSDNETAGYLDCAGFIANRLPGDIDLDAPCPFDDQLCRTTSANVRFDTGYINSHEHLGMNAPVGQRILWRNVLHCAPLATEGYTSQDVTPTDNYTRYHYGKIYANSSTARDYIYKAPSVESQYAAVLSYDTYVSSTDHYLQVLVARSKNETVWIEGSDFIPIDELTRNDADLHLVLLSGNGVIYFGLTSDVWYQLNSTPANVYTVSAGAMSEFPIYLPSEPASPLACAEQHQFCNPAIEGSEQCGPLASLQDAMAGAAPLFNTTYTEMTANAAQTELGARFSYFTRIIRTMPNSISTALLQLGPKGLASHKLLYNGFQGVLADNQWQLDMTYLWGVTMAATQASFVGTANGPTDPAILSIHTNYTGMPYMDDICNNQIIRSKSYASFSMFGLCFTFVMGFLLILASYLLEPISGYLFKKQGYKEYAHLEWVTNATLQLQRLAHEEAGKGTWSKCLDMVPVTQADELLGSLDTTDRHHPIIRHTQSGSDRSAETQSTSEASTAADGQSIAAASHKDEVLRTDTGFSSEKHELRVETTMSPTEEQMLSPTSTVAGEEITMISSNKTTGSLEAAAQSGENRSPCIPDARRNGGPAAAPGHLEH